MITHVIFRPKSYAYIHIDGAPDLNEYIAAAMRFIDDPDYCRNLNRICDFSDASLSPITLMDVKKFSDFAGEYIPISYHTKIALIAPNFKIKSLCETFMDRIGTGRFQVFGNLEHAKIWIGEERPTHGSAGFGTMNKRKTYTHAAEKEMNIEH